jgi:hypothetical protein
MKQHSGQLRDGKDDEDPRRFWTRCPCVLTLVDHYGLPRLFSSCSSEYIKYGRVAFFPPQTGGLPHQIFSPLILGLPS